MIKINNRQICDIKEACEISGCSRRTIYNWITTGKIEYVKTAGKRTRIYVDSLFKTSNGEKIQVEFSE